MNRDAREATGGVVEEDKSSEDKSSDTKNLASREPSKSADSGGKTIDSGGEENSSTDNSPGSPKSRDVSTESSRSAIKKRKRDAVDSDNSSSYKDYTTVASTSDSNGQGTEGNKTTASSLTNIQETDKATDPVESDDGPQRKPRKKHRVNYRKSAVALLKSWLFNHMEHPYPTDEEKLQLAEQTNLTVYQIGDWFINARRRILKPMLAQMKSAERNPKVSFEGGDAMGQQMRYLVNRPDLQQPQDYTPAIPQGIPVIGQNMVGVNQVPQYPPQTYIQQPVPGYIHPQFMFVQGRQVHVAAFPPNNNMVSQPQIVQQMPVPQPTVIGMHVPPNNMPQNHQPVHIQQGQSPGIQPMQPVPVPIPNDQYTPDYTAMPPQQPYVQIPMQGYPTNPSQLSANFQQANVESNDRFRS
eukprot:Clim_evm79s152 gene=Clim_evmTU79s152